MKRIKILMLLIPTLCLSACNDFFDVSPKGSVALEDYQTKLNNLRISLNAVYSLMQTEDYQLSELIFGESISDNAYNMQDNESSDLSQLLNFQFNTENSYILNRYQTNFRGINLANQVISAVPNVVYNADYSSGAQQMRYILGQAKLLRALFYFNLVRSFGGVPIQPEESVLSQTVVARSSADDIYAYIEKDLREACLILYKDRYKDTDAGQAAIGAGLGLLMKVLAYQASPGTELVSPQRATKWEEAKEIGELFIDGKSMTYEKMLKFTERYTGTETWDELCERLVLTDQAPTLETTISGDVANVHALIEFGDLFRLKSKFSKESLFEINHYDYSSSGSTIDERNLLYRCFNENTSYSVGPVPTQAIYDYRQTDPRGIFTAAAQTDMGSNFFKDENGNSVTLQWFNTAYGYVFTKYMVYPSEGTVYERNYMVMRYAEALLWYAEILNETGDQTRATEVVNKVRARAAKLLDSSNDYAQYNTQITSFKLYNVLPYEEVRKNIQNERRIELAGEFDRWFDLQRLGLLSEKMAYLASKNSEAADKNSGKPRWRGKYFKKGVNELMPIPQREITLSNGVITQNFGY
jgi:starch-binding outer membrane protein, SusD/RagB family